MREVFLTEEESSSMSLAVSQISQRDYASTEDLLQSFANFINVFGSHLNRTDDVSSLEEDIFLIECEKVIGCLFDATERIRKLVLKG